MSATTLFWCSMGNKWADFAKWASMKRPWSESLPLIQCLYWQKASQSGLLQTDQSDERESLLFQRESRCISSFAHFPVTIKRPEIHCSYEHSASEAEKHSRGQITPSIMLNSVITDCRRYRSYWQNSDNVETRVHCQFTLSGRCFHGNHGSLLMKHESSRGLKRRDNMATGIWKF